MIELAQANAVRIPLADESVQCVVTSPPYFGLRSYGLSPLLWGGGREDCWHEWDKTIPRVHQGGGNSGVPEEWQRPSRAAHTGGTSGQFCQLCGCWRGQLGLEPDVGLYVQHLVEVFREVRRVLRRDGTVWLVIGDSYAGSWGNYMPGGYKGKQRPQTERGKRWDRQAYGDTSFLPPTANIQGLKPKDLCMIPARVALALQADGWWLRSEITWCKKAPMPESVRDRPTSATEKIFLLSKSKKYYYDQEAVRVLAACADRDDGTGHYRGNRQNLTKYDSARLTSRDNREAMNRISSGRNMWNYLLLGPEPFSGEHYAAFPSSIPDIAIRAGTSQHGCCPKCGKAWVRETDKSRQLETGRKVLGLGKKTGGDGMTSHGQGATSLHHTVDIRTIGWRPTCSHYPETELWQKYPRQGKDENDSDYIRRIEPIRRERQRLLALWKPMETVPAVVLDPFVGSGTTLLVARKLGRSAVGLDLSYDYLHDQARVRLELDKMSEWEDGPEPVEANWDDLPLFGGET